MKINRLDIVNFGKLSGFSLDFSGGFQTIFGNNEDGKSTLMAFIKLMFYSDQGRTKSLDQRPRQRYTPWNGSPMEGAIELEKDGVRYRLQKLFGATASKDQITLLNMDTGTPITLAQNQEVGHYFFGLDLPAFKRSSFIKQLGAIGSAGNASDDIAEKLLSNLTNTGDEDVSQQSVITRLETAKYDMISKRGDKGLLASARIQLEELKDEKEQVKRQLDSQEDLLYRYRLLQEKLDNQDLLEKNIKIVQQRKRQAKIGELMTYHQQIDNVTALLETDSYHLKEIPELLTSSAHLLRQRTGELEGIKSLEDSIAGKSLISTAENNALVDLLHKETAIDRFAARYENSLLPEREKLDQLGGHVADLEEKVALLKEKKTSLEPAKDHLEALQSGLEQIDASSAQLTASFEQNQEMWQREKDLQSKEIETHGAQIDELLKKKKKSPHLVLLIIGIVFALATTGLLVYFRHPIFAIGYCPFLLFLFLSFLFGKQKFGSQLEMLQDTLDASTKGFQHWEKTSAIERKSLEEKLSDLRSRREATEGEIDTLRRTFRSEEYQETETELLFISDNLQKEIVRRQSAEENISQLKDQIRAEMLTEHLTLPEENEEFLDCLATNRHQVETEMSVIFEEKQISSVEEFKAMYLKSKAEEQNLETIETKKKLIFQLEAEFSSLINTHSPATDFPDAKQVFKQIAENLQKRESLTEELQLMAKALGLEDYSMKSLQESFRENSTIALSNNTESLEDLERALAAMKIENIIGQMKDLQQQIHLPERNLEQIHLELSEWGEQVQEMESYYRSICLALDVMNEAQEEMRQSFGPLLNKKTGAIFAKLTNHKYTDVLVNKDYDIQFKIGAHYRQWQYLSSGTTDQAYLALRLAISELISEKDNPIPLFLDDVLIQYDDTRTQLALDFLKEYSESKGFQIILFTCHHRLMDFAKEIDIPTMSI